MSDRTAVPTSIIAVLIALGAVWGAAFMLIKVLLDEIGAIDMVAARLALGALVILGILAVRGRLGLPGWRLAASVIVLGIFDTLVPYALVTWAETHIDSGQASALISATPLFTVLIACVATDERIGAAQAGGIAVGFSGVLLMIGPEAVGAGEPIGRIAVVGAAASYGVGAVYARALLRTTDALRLTGYKLGAAAAIAVPICLATGGADDFGGLSARGVAAILTLGVVSTGLAYAAYFRVVSTVGSVPASVVTYIVPAFGLFFGWTLLGETIEPGTIAGVALIVGGVAGVMYGRSLRTLVVSRMLPARAAPSP